MTLGCEQVEPWLAQYVTGDLPNTSSTQVREHLQQCSSCREELARERLLRDSLAGLPERSCPPPLRQQILAAATTSPPRNSRRERSRLWPRLRLGQLIPATAVILAAAILLINRQPDPQVREPDPVYSAAEIQAARLQAKWSLKMALEIVNQSEREAAAAVFGKQFPQALRKSLRKAIQPSEGGQG
jgi:anti-sigma factor RsiW